MWPRDDLVGGMTTCSTVGMRRGVAKGRLSGWHDHMQYSWDEGCGQGTT